MTQFQKGISVMNYLEGLGMEMMAIGQAISDENLEKSYQLIQENPQITKKVFLMKMEIEEEN